MKTCIPRLGLALLLAFAAVATHAAESPRVHPSIQAAVDSPNRPAKDRTRDANRRYAEVLEFFGVRPGMQLIELFAATGTTTEVLARAVGGEEMTSGKVIMHNPPWFLERAGAARIDERLAGNRLPNVERLDRSLDELNLEPGSLDGVVAYLVFHDFFWLSKDVPALLKQLHAALKPGGFVAVVDHAAPAGSGSRDALDRDGGTHRIDEEYVKKIFAEAGFTLAASSEALRTPADDRTKAFFHESLKGKDTDRFMLKFVKTK